MCLRLLAPLFALAPLVAAQAPCDFTDLLAPDGQQLDELGYSVSLKEERLLVGATGDSMPGEGYGSAYVFRRGPGGWVMEQKLIPPTVSRQFGISVAMGTNRLAVGAVTRDSGLSGGAFVYRWDAGLAQWILETDLAVPGSGPTHGLCITMQNDDEVFVAHPQTTSATGGGGVVEMFQRSGSTWAAAPQIIALDGAPCDHFGLAIAVDGDVLAVGAPFAGGARGATYVHRRAPGGIWFLEQKLVDAGAALGDTFGFPLAVDDDVLAVSALRLTNSGPGRVHLHRYDPTTATWPQTQVLQEGLDPLVDEFGRGLALEGPLLVVGSPVDGAVGRVYTFHLSGASATWVPRGDRVGPHSVIVDGFGWSVTLDRGFAVVGAPNGGAGGASRTGGAFGIDLWACEAVGSSYCGPANPNSSGDSARISATGSDVAGDRLLFLTATDLPLGQFGFFLGSMQQGFVANPGGSNGNLCLGLPVGRFNRPDQIRVSEEGIFSLAVDTTNMPVTPPMAILPGATWNFQAWFRDVNPGPTSNFTDAVEVLFM